MLYCLLQRFKSTTIKKKQHTQLRIKKGRFGFENSWEMRNGELFFYIVMNEFMLGIDKMLDMQHDQGKQFSTGTYLIAYF